MGAMVPPSRKSCYNFRVVEIDRVVDGDTIDVTIDLGFDLFKKERVRVAGVDTPEKEPGTLKKRSWELKQRIGISKRNWMVPLVGMTILLSVLKLVGGMGKYGRLLGWALHRRCSSVFE